MIGTMGSVAGADAVAGGAAGPGAGGVVSRPRLMISLGSTEFWAARFEEAERHL